MDRGQEAGGAASPTRDCWPLSPDFDLVLLDLHMPHLDGFHVVGAIRERERVAGGHLPVIALTARSRKEDRDRCLEAGMDGFLAKPVRPAELLAAIERAVTGIRLAAPPARPELLDAAVLLAASGGDPVGLQELCQDLRTYAPARLAEVGDALWSRDALRLREAAHKLCGLLSAFSTAAGSVASDVEDHAAEGRLEAAAPLVGRLEWLVHALLSQVEDLSLTTLRARAVPPD